MNTIHLAGVLALGTPLALGVARGTTGAVQAAAPEEDAIAPPPLFRAMQDQLDLKLNAQKIQVPVVVIDHVDHPSPN